MKAAVKRLRQPQTITAWQRGRHTGAVKGPVRVVHPVLRSMDIPWMWDADSGAYLVNRKRLDDVLAALELAGHIVNYQQAMW